ncbi:MAG: hypothetical protein WDO24_05455 [Pseudomonadota bacterium]
MSFGRDAHLLEGVAILGHDGNQLGKNDALLVPGGARFGPRQTCERFVDVARGFLAGLAMTIDIFQHRDVAAERRCCTRRTTLVSRASSPYSKKCRSADSKPNFAKMVMSARNDSTTPNPAQIFSAIRQFSTRQ